MSLREREREIEREEREIIIIAYYTKGKIGQMLRIDIYNHNPALIT